MPWEGKHLSTVTELEHWTLRNALPPAPNTVCRCGLESKLRSVAAYVGPHYDTRFPRILFVGLDSGRGWGEPLVNVHSVQEERVKDCREEQQAWNPHYKGCVRTAAAILGLDCERDCKQNCAKKESLECAFLRLSQANAVRCVGVDEKDSDCRSQNRVAKCLPYLFSEICILRPDVIVLQGRNQRTGHLHKSFRQELGRGEWGELQGEELDLVQEIRWLKCDAWQGPTWLASLRHPSSLGRLRLEAIWESHYRPAVERIRKHLGLGS